MMTYTNKANTLDMFFFSFQQECFSVLLFTLKVTQTLLCNIMQCLRSKSETVNFNLCKKNLNTLMAHLCKHL